jgi:Fe-S oxidoreductase
MRFTSWLELYEFVEVSRISAEPRARMEEGLSMGAGAPSDGANGRARADFVARWRDAAYGCYSSGHKFCREVCPVTQVTRNENHSPTAFHTNIVAMERGLLDVAEVADDYVHCTQCGACELRCPNTLFTGDFYRHRTRTVEVVKAMRALMVDTGNERPQWKRWIERLVEASNEPVLGEVPIEQEHVADWAAGLELAVGGETVLFVDCEAAFYRTSYARAIAQLLNAAGVEFGLMREQWCCGGPAAEMGYVEQARAFAEHNVADWRAVGARRIVAADPHDYIAFTEDYPRYFGESYDFEIVLAVELVAERVRDGRLQLTNPVRRVATYHDPCRLNKRKGVHAAPRELLRAVPGLRFVDVDHVTQWSYCSGAGGGLPIEKPEITAEISRRRVARAAELEVDTLVSACPWSERPLSAAGSEQGIEVVDLFELVAEAAGIEVGGSTRAVAPMQAEAVR